MAAAYCRLGNYNRKKQIRWLQLQKVFESKENLVAAGFEPTYRFNLLGREEESKEKQNWCRGRELDRTFAH